MSGIAYSLLPGILLLIVCPFMFRAEQPPEQVFGDSVNSELRTSAHDTVELRDGSVLSGDDSVSATEVTVRIGGTLQHLSRHQVKRIALIEPEAAADKRTELWIPPDIDRVIPEVKPAETCSLPEVLSRAGKRIEELAQNVDKFTASETVQHQKVIGSNHLGDPEIHRFNYLVAITRAASGNMNVEEYQDGGLGQFPDGIATLGTPALVLIFHPHYLTNFDIKCEGLGQWRARPAWQVRFEEHQTNNSISTIVIAGRVFNLRLRGRAWILADSYQVARLETDLADQIPQIQMRLQHQNVEYRPVILPASKREIWLPAKTELYMDFHGHRFYRQHTFTDLQFFSVNVQQTIADPKELEKRGRASSR